MTASRRRARSAIATRLLPLQVAVMLQGFLLWAPIEKLFMSEIGFDAAAVGVMAAAYAAVVPIFELPSGLLADRWSRRGVLVIASLALAASALIGGLSTGVASYICSALLLGGYFAMYSGTMEAVVYDTLLEETGGSGDFEHRIGRIRALESASLVVSSLLGGLLAAVVGTRFTYFLTVPIVLLSVVAYLRFREPLLHRVSAPQSLRSQVVVTVRTITDRRRLLPIVTLAALSAVVLQLIFEFGPLWLVALAAPAVFYGPHWAALMSALGLGGLVAGRLGLHRPVRAAGVGVAMTAAAALLTVATSLIVVTIAQIVLALLMVACGIHVTRLLHDEIPSAVRAGVASGVSSVSWLVFLPIALCFGLIGAAQGVHSAGWLLVALTAGTGGLITWIALRQDRSPDAEPLAVARLES